MKCPVTLTFGYIKSRFHYMSLLIRIDLCINKKQQYAIRKQHRPDHRRYQRYRA